jgi:hypothetical protein
MTAGSQSVVTGRLARAGTLEEFTHAAKDPVRKLLAGRHPDRVSTALLVWGEVVANCYLHTRSPYLRYYAQAERSPERVKLVAIYLTPRFNTAPPEPELYALSGRGIWLVRELCSETLWRWNGPELWVTMRLKWEIE